MYTTITFEQFKELMHKARIHQGADLGIPSQLGSCRSVIYPEGENCTLYHITACTSKLWYYSLFRVIHSANGDIYQHIKEHTDKL